MGLFGSKQDHGDLMRRALDLTRIDQHKGTVALLNRILKDEPHHREALYNKGLSLNQLRKYNRCRDLL